jgi:hypothetical protein
MNQEHSSENLIFETDFGGDSEAFYEQNSDFSNISLDSESELIQMKDLEKICENIGFDLHLKIGKQILRKFLLFCFPKGIQNLITPSKIKTQSLKI